MASNDYLELIIHYCSPVETENSSLIVMMTGSLASYLNKCRLNFERIYYGDKTGRSVFDGLRLPQLVKYLQRYWKDRKIHFL